MNQETSVPLRYLLKKIIKIIICIVATCTGYRYVSRNRANKKGLMILTYHSIDYEIEPDETVIPEEFEKQLKYIKENYHVISLEEAVKYLHSDIERVSGSIVITFDDGYSNNFHIAYPLLKKYNFPATIFLISDFINKDGGRYLSSPQIREMEKNNISFGSHTISHKILTSLTHEEIVREIRGSKDILETELHKRINSFAYPVGSGVDFNDKIKEIVQSSGYTCACSNMYGVNDRNTDIFALKRIGIETTDDFFIFKKKLNGALDILALKDTKFFQRLKRTFFN